MSEHASALHAADVRSWFSDQEWSEFQTEDKLAGGTVVCLMAGIFTIGLVLYSIVAIVVGA
jgi:hypothetical protein